jgi:hypothetical protein
LKAANTKHVFDFIRVRFALPSIFVPCQLTQKNHFDKKFLRYGKDSMKNSNFTFTITSTDRCNAACTYCHYYSAGGKAAKRTGGIKRSLFRSDIDDTTLEAYFSFIAYFKKKFPTGNTILVNNSESNGVSYSTDPEETIITS